MSSLAERAMPWLEEAVVVAAKVLATAVLLPFALWLPGPEFLIARMWGKTLTDDD
ncbi:MAG: hypothetical protein OXS47_03865 [Chloroflexota bacterium]|nr:hypothetical protein [Chloroflexota bacterium]